MQWRSRSVVALMILALLPGCIGGAVLREDEIRASARTLSRERAGLEGPALAGLREPSPEQLRRAWGEPDRIDPIPGGERWHYDRELGWSGVFVMLVVVPVPLLVPVGYRETIVVVDGDRISHAIEQRTAASGFMCGLLWGHGWHFACG